MSLHGWPLGNQLCLLGDKHEDDTWKEHSRRRFFWHCSLLGGAGGERGFVGRKGDFHAGWSYFWRGKGR